LTLLLNGRVASVNLEFSPEYYQNAMPQKIQCSKTDIWNVEDYRPAAPGAQPFFII